ncbi:hypothetical protein M406DRAFT_99144 [Cryphonectria parasitica EP155]|uniref:UBX domain-containing protein n=1 Tax=Cryphonectria parasitica (strain ATCC 38755 / EP155) TaxID=660469 RepID=A0A9P4XWQ4_CRYP1|nr:uncharacterized protein M406DRAFT_99144 [Cryphonectria parasitica EP155]KAF3762699.1 hypothetical protein M406DRAFT_99144 [Cryphonectria parasitica EP155]
MDDAVAQFMAFTNQNATVAAGCLSMTDGDVMAAVNMFFENPDIANSFSDHASANAATSSSSATAGAATSAPAAQPQSLSRSAGREDPSGVIHIDSDDDVDFDGLDDDSGEHVESIERIQRIAQENDDEAIARRMQEEMYGQNAMDTDGVRAPIARTTETLVAPSGYAAAADEDDYSALPGFMTSRARTAQLRGNPFGQSIWEDDAQPPGPPSFAEAAGGSAAGGERARRLADLFRPPYQLMSHLSWDDAREEGKASKMWILVNVQDMNDFNCQALNRDIWKDDAITALVQESFIFLQYSKDDPRATEYNTFYFPHHAQENRDNFPHVAIIDPRTGEQVKVWSGIPFPSAQDFLSQLVEFLDRYSLARNSKNPVSKQKAPQRAVDVDRMTEEEMLELAMRNSLATNGHETSAAAVNVHDPDALTKSLELDKNKGKGDSVFAEIAADRPHVEPEQSPRVTRIQFRHANGRVIRRFLLSDPVRRIYEWLKAEPLDGGAGAVFELKVMPQGKDLLDDLDRTVEEAGLKQATVMVEYIGS